MTGSIGIGGHDNTSSLCLPHLQLASIVHHHLVRHDDADTINIDDRTIEQLVVIVRTTSASATDVRQLLSIHDDVTGSISVGRDDDTFADRFRCTVTDTAPLDCRGRGANGQFGPTVSELSPNFDIATFPLSSIAYQSPFATVSFVAFSNGKMYVFHVTPLSLDIAL